jgi:hypothetical protein
MGWLPGGRVEIDLLVACLEADREYRLQYFYTRSKVTTWGGPITYSFEMDLLTTQQRVAAGRYILCEKATK